MPRGRRSTPAPAHALRQSSPQMRIGGSAGAYDRSQLDDAAMMYIFLQSLPLDSVNSTSHSAACIAPLAWAEA